MADEKPGQSPTDVRDEQSRSAPFAEGKIGTLEAKINALEEELKSEALVAAVRKGEKWIIGINGLLLIATIVIAFIYYGQLKQMRIATTATQDAVDVASRTLCETQRSNASQAKLSTKTLQATIDNYHRDQRAWVGIKGMDYPNLLDKTGKQVLVKIRSPVVGVVVISNFGKSPALHLTSWISIQMLRSGVKLVPKYKFDTKFPTASVLEPGVEVRLRSLPIDSTVPGIPGILTQANLDDISSGRYIVYVYGFTTYKDVFNQPHITKFCEYLLRDHSGYSGCNTYNESN